MARVTHVKKAQQRFKMVPALDGQGNQKVIPVLRKDGTPKKTKAGKEITRRLTVEDRTQPLPNRKCDKCSTEIKVGDPYKWIKPKSGPYGGSMRVRCATCPTWRPSETTSSPALGTLYAAQEQFEEDLAGAEEADAIREALTALAEGVREAGQVYTEGADNMEEGFGHETSMSSELREKGEALESAADEIEGKADEIEDWDEDAAIEEVEADILSEYLGTLGMDTALSLVDALAFTADEDDEDAPEEFDQQEYQRLLDEAVEEKKAEWLEEQTTAAQEAAESANEF